MVRVGVSSAELRAVVCVVTSVLELSTLAFGSSDDGGGAAAACVPREGEACLERVAALLELPTADGLRGALTCRQLAMGGREVMAVPLKLDQAVAARDALLKALYARLFEWLVQRCNATLVTDPHSTSSFVGVLDIFGFE
eukprot:2138897-Prymnesium_polylepis.1